MVKREKGGDEEKSLLVPTGFAIRKEAPHVTVYPEQSTRLGSQTASEFCQRLPVTVVDEALQVVHECTFTFSHRQS
jgi:hypothetical protein